MAKGGGSTSSPVPVSAGPCVNEFIADGNFTRYPLSNDNFPGIVVVDMVPGANGAPSLQNVCLDAGWSVESKAVTGGVQLRFSYNGVKAIDFKYVLGKTDIRGY